MEVPEGSIVEHWHSAKFGGVDPYTPGRVTAECRRSFSPERVSLIYPSEYFGENSSGILCHDCGLTRVMSSYL